MRDGQGFMHELSVDAEQSDPRSARKQFFQGELKIHPCRDGENTTGCNQILKAMFAEMALEACLDKWERSLLGFAHRLRVLTSGLLWHGDSLPVNLFEDRISATLEQGVAHGLSEFDGIASVARLAQYL